jgi:aspartyl/glutamyl-tRNA(Asn/Gln) amidotransferase C subunit
MSVEAVSLEQVRRVAELANLELTPEEEPRMQRDLNAILEHIAQLNELDTKDVQAMAQVGEMPRCDRTPSGHPSTARPSWRPRPKAMDASSRFPR